MKINKNIAISESGFIFNASKGDSFSANATALKIINMIKEGKTEDEIKAYLLETYATDEATIEKDWLDFMKTLEHFNLIL